LHFVLHQELFKRNDKDVDSSSAFIGTRETAQSHSLLMCMASKKKLQKEMGQDIKYITLEKLRQ